MYGFDKSRRLLTKKDYDVVFKQAKKIACEDFIFLYCYNSHEQARLGMAISKKNVAKAHDRNLIKRLLRETFRLKPNLPSVDVVVLMKRKQRDIQKTEVKQSLDTAWKKMAISCSK